MAVLGLNKCSERIIGSLEENTEDINKTIIEFGTGDIRITSGVIEGVAVLGLNKCSERIIGSLEENTEDINKILDSDVFMKFNSIKSLEVLILKLQESRSMIINNEIPYKNNIDNITDIYEPNSIIKG